MEATKVWWKSKTIWVNLIALAGSVVVSLGIDPSKWAEVSTVALAAVNLILRFVTKEEITLQPEVR
ncbi:MAG TPA: hypothetical protein VK463_09620 [Desulfomonilaceae bacterium]|nr:hypothetical protein [Desulfomonilaceae bacterium]